MTDLAHTPLELLSRLESTKQASRQLNAASPATRDAALAAIAEGLAAHAEQIVAANVLDLERGVREGMTQGLQDRLRLTPQRVEGLVEAVKVIASLPDPLGHVVREMTLANGLEVSQWTGKLATANCPNWRRNFARKSSSRKKSATHS